MSLKDPKIYDQLAGLQTILDIDKLLDDNSRELGIYFTAMEPGTVIPGATSSGILCFDLMLGGGFAPGRFHYFYGPTGSCKTTTSLHAIKESLDKKAMIMIHDHEGSMEPNYMAAIGIDIEKALGKRNKKGEWDVKPQLRYSYGTTAEDTFRFMHRTLKGLPDKIAFHDETTGTTRYFLVKNEYKTFRQTPMHINAGLKSGQVVEVEDFSPQTMFFIDSLKAMLPEARDEEDDKEPIAVLARCFHAYFPMIKSLLARKNCLWVATNHLTINPMARFASPETEPGGNAVLFWPDTKIKLNVNRARNKIVSEPHVSGTGDDEYLPGKATILKNKNGAVFRTMDYRIWLSEQGKPGRGIDPVFDTFNFLDECGLLEEVETKKSEDDRWGIKLKGLEDRNYSYPEFKFMVLTEKKGEKLRATCKELLKTGKAQEMYYENYAASSAKKDKKKKDESDGKKTV